MKKLIIFPLIFTLFVSCKKNKDSTCNLSTASLSGSYRITAVRYKDTPTSPETDYYNQFFTEACERDDILTLNANGTYTYADAGVKCSPTSDDTGAWSFAGNTLTIDGGPENVDSFNCSILSLSSSDVFNTGDKLILILTRQ